MRKLSQKLTYDVTHKKLKSETFLFLKSNVQHFPHL